MTRLRTDKMRHTLERSGRIAEERQRLEWLSAMTPEHRAMHERSTPPPFCGVCINEGARRAADNLQRTMSAFNAVSARRP